MSTQQAIPARTVPAPPTRADRCDRCPAAAQVRALMTFGELLFCGHHARAFRDGLADAGAVIVPGTDPRAR